MTHICNSRPQISRNTVFFWQIIFSVLVSLSWRLLLKSPEYMWGWWFFSPKHVLFILVCCDLCWEHEIQTDKLESNLTVMMLQEKEKSFSACHCDTCQRRFFFFLFLLVNYFILSGSWEQEVLTQRSRTNFYVSLHLTKVADLGFVASPRGFMCNSAKKCQLIEDKKSQKKDEQKSVHQL